MVYFKIVSLTDWLEDQDIIFKRNWSAENPG